MRELASDLRCTVPQIAIAWLLHQKVVTSVIVGARRVDQLSDRLDQSTFHFQMTTSARSPRLPTCRQNIQDGCSLFKTNTVRS